MKPSADDAQLISDLATFLKKYVRLSDDGEYLVIAVWVLHCHTFLAWTRTPYLHLSSATQECGKTLLLELIELLVPNAMFVMGCSSAVLPRAIDQEHPVLLIDEVDQLMAGDKELWATILQTGNSGYKKSGTRLVSEMAKGGWTAKRLSTFCAKAWSGISGLPSATASRCIPINMQRMMPKDRVAEIDEYITEPEADGLFKRSEAWGRAHLKKLRDARPDAPAEMGHRQREVSRPLLAIADAMGDGWGEQLRAALLRVFMPREDEPDTNIRIQLLHDMEDVFGDRQRISSGDAARKLGEDTDAPWSAWGRSQKPITQAQLAKQLSHFKIWPRRQRNDDGTNLRGYNRAQFEDLWKRYPKPQPANSTDPITSTTPALEWNNGTNSENKEDSDLAEWNNTTDVPPLKSALSSLFSSSIPGVPLQTRENGKEGVLAECHVHGETAHWERPDGSLVCDHCHPQAGGKTQ